MVYCGKPSQACGPCRAKKTRCDKARPSCGQCVRTKTRCEGYRDDSDLLFRDQTEAVAERVQSMRTEHRALVRAHKTPTSRRGGGSSLVGEESSSSSFSFQTGAPASPPPSLIPHVDEFANMAFYNQFLANPLAPGKDGFGLVPSVYLNADSTSSLTELVTALGLASHPVMKNDVEVQQLARRRYAKALSLTNRALGDPERRLKDETLMTIILLAMYELITGADMQSIKSWTAHVSGAIHLLIMRGEEQFRSEVGVAMFTHMRARIYVSCIQRCAPIPVALLDLSRRCMSYHTEDELVASDLLDVVADFSILQSEIATDAVTARDDIFRRLYGLDAKLKAWIDNVPPSYYRTKVIDSDNAFACDGYYDLYPTKFAAMIMNNASVIDIILNQVLRHYLRESPGRPGVAGELAAVTDTIRRASADICATLPFLMGDVKPLAGSQAAPNLYGYTNLAWILYPIISDDAGHPKTRQWCFQLLMRVSEITGLRQARTLALMAKDDVNISAYTRD